MARHRPIPSTLGLYLAGDDGHVYREQRVTAGGRLVPRRRMAEGLYGSTRWSRDRGEYLRVRTCVGGVCADRPVHRLVAEAWLPDFHPLLEVHHVNGDRLDNRPCNLACLTRAEHERAHGMGVADADVASARLDFELRRGDPAPCPYVAARLAAKRGSQRRWRAGRRGRSGVAEAARLVEACARAVGRHVGRAGAALEDSDRLGGSEWQ